MEGRARRGDEAERLSDGDDDDDDARRGFARERRVVVVVGDGERT